MVGLRALIEPGLENQRGRKPHGRTEHLPLKSLEATSAHPAVWCLSNN